MADEAREIIEDLVLQFGYRSARNRQTVIGTAGLSALEWAFQFLGWKDPHPIPWAGCQAKGCYQPATCGTPTPDGYKSLCGNHYREINPPKKRKP